MSELHASYRAAGVDYDALDAAKRLAMAGALATSPQLRRHGARAEDSSRGELAFVFEPPAAAASHSSWRASGRSP